MPEAQNTTVFSKKVSLIQSADTAINAGVISGTLAYVEHWTGYSPSDDEMATGNYLALKTTKGTNVAKVTCEIYPGNKGELELDADLNVVFRIASKEQVIIYRAYDSSNALLETHTYKLDGLTLETE